MNINWDKIFTEYPSTVSHNKKFTLLPRALPWGDGLEANLWATVELLYRDGRKDEVRMCEEPVLNPIRGGWFRCEMEDGLFLHACYPEEIISFRRQYESILFCIQEQERDPDGANMLQEMHRNCAAARQRLWSAWNCLGRDGQRKDPELVESKNIDRYQVDFLSAIPWHDWPRCSWEGKCSRCCVELPKALQVWVKLQYSKLAEANR